tara:strand:- start:142 stop:486 length:345 start_codon:yes stop_codon:yes gene_type:complete
LAEKKIKPIQVKAPYATAEEKLIFPVEAFEEAIVIEALKLPGIDDHFGDNELDQPVIGIFSKPLSGKVLPTPGDYTGARRSGGNFCAFTTGSRTRPFQSLRKIVPRVFVIVENI